MIARGGDQKHQVEAAGELQESPEKQAAPRLPAVPGKAPMSREALTAAPHPVWCLG